MTLAAVLTLCRTLNLGAVCAVAADDQTKLNGPINGCMIGKCRLAATKDLHSNIFSKQRLMFPQVRAIFSIFATLSDFVPSGTNIASLVVLVPTRGKQPAGRLSLGPINSCSFEDQDGGKATGHSVSAVVSGHSHEQHGHIFISCKNEKKTTFHQNKKN